MPAKSTDITGKAKLKCLKCGRQFISWDRRKNRLCKKCQEINENLIQVYLPEALGIVSNPLIIPMQNTILG
jgi:hypothetical protein